MEVVSSIAHEPISKTGKSAKNQDFVSLSFLFSEPYIFGIIISCLRLLSLSWKLDKRFLERKIKLTFTGKDRKEIKLTGQ